MNTVLERLPQPTWLLVSLVVAILVIAALTMLMLVSGVYDTEQLVGPFRWVPSEGLA